MALIHMISFSESVNAFNVNFAFGNYHMVSVVQTKSLTKKFRIYT